MARMCGFVTDGHYIRERLKLGHAEAGRAIDPHVFFWPGLVNGPIESGRNHYARYKDDAIAVLRVRTTDILNRESLFSPAC